MKLNAFRIVAVTLAAVAAPLATGCAGPDLSLPNPIVAGHLPTNDVARPHGFAESNRGLPVGVMTDHAVIEKLDPAQVCVSVSLHELSAIDVANAKISFTSDTGSVPQPVLTAQPPSEMTYEGLVPQTVQTGTRVVCTDNGNSVTCHSEPVMSTTMVPGPVTVYTTKGRVCAPNQGLVTAATKKLALEVSTPTAARSMWGFGHGNKGNTFRWQLL